MKKIIMSKVDTGDKSAHEASPPIMDSFLRVQNALSPSEPPLPNYAPKDTNLLVPKKEYENPEYHTSTVEYNESYPSNTNPTEPPASTSSSTPGTSNTNKSEIICRDFNRGKCKRAFCRFPHKIDSKQMGNVEYIFCHNFQNAKCTRVKCKFVHGTISEEENYRKTGYLPPHTLAHHRNEPTEQSMANVAGPSETIGEMVTSKIVTNGTNKTTPVIACIPEASIVHGKHANMNNTWPFPSMPLVRENKPQSKCDNCVVLANRYEHTNSRLESMRSNKKEIEAKLHVLKNKREKLIFLAHCLKIQLPPLTE